MEKQLESLYCRCALYITGQNRRQNKDGTWTYSTSENVLEMAGLCTIQEYIKSWRNMVMKYARSRFIYRKCEESKSLASYPNQAVWWKPGGGIISTDANMPVVRAVISP
jgi:hypothetical protein